MCSASFRNPVRGGDSHCHPPPRRYPSQLQHKRRATTEGGGLATLDGMVGGGLATATCVFSAPHVSVVGCRTGWFLDEARFLGSDEFHSLFVPEALVLPPSTRQLSQLRREAQGFDLTLEPALSANLRGLLSSPAGTARFDR